ncbi:matrix metalloproteinase-14-like [Patiria miniata]|uniref:Peptidase metallopeptidase domain-containing protein n=1 Tax=Patiria miniata TaxID=46514 RepID=A0A913ZYB8_PATMI|nr:matrix metalloproteinase-14-like [Patiria miniata]
MASLTLTSLISLVVSLQAVLYVQSKEVQHLMSGVGFLQKYGYMGQPDPNANELISEIDVRQAVMLMQRFSHLPMTGEIDEETARMMNKPRCGLPDLPSRNRDSRWYGTRGYRGGRARRYLAEGVRWYKQELTYYFDNFTPDLSRTQVRDAIERAFKTWSDVTPLRFREIQSGNPDIHIKFARRSHGDSYAFDGRGGTLAHAFFPGADIGGDAHFDDDETFTYASYEGTNLFTVAAHELGHSLGLGHSDVPGALMAPYYQGYDPEFRLLYDDIAGIQSLYGSNPRPPPRPQPRPTSPPEPTNPPVTAEPTLSPTCVGKFSAVSDIRGEVFIFKKDQMWRLSNSGTPLTGYPMPTSRFWQMAPSGADAVFEKLDGSIVFIKGTRHWEFNGLSLKRGFPQDLPRLTGGEPSEVDAVLSLRREAKTYFFKGDLCWRFDGMDEQMEGDYPKLITEEWVGGPDRVDAAFHFDNNVYLIKGNQYWQFSDGSMTAEAGTRWLTVDFLGCSEDTVVTDDVGIPDDAIRTASGLWICVASALVALLFFR